MYKLKIVAAAVFAGLFIFGCSRQEEHPMNKALKAAMEGEWVKADKPSEEALKKTPDNVNALILRALICEKLNRYDEAVGNAIKAVTVDSSSFAATYTLGRLYSLDSRRRNDAVNLLIMANRIRPDHPYPLILLSNLHKPGQKSSYLAALSAIPEYANAPEVVFESHMNRVYNRDHRGVREAYLKLFNAYPDHPELASAIGGYFDFCRQYDVARMAYRRYLAFPAERRSSARSAWLTRRLSRMK